MPTIISGPTKYIDGQTVTLQCQFNASTIDGVTIAVWKRNNIQLFNSSQYKIDQTISPGIEDLVTSTLRIIDSSYNDGTYSCYCYYNSSLVTSNKPITSNQNSITLTSGKGKGIELYTTSYYP